MKKMISSSKPVKIISIITPSYNQGEFIEETIQSVLSQEGRFFIDYIIMDGGSSDNSIKIIKKYENLLREECKKMMVNGHIFYVSKQNGFKWNQCCGISYRWVSEKDNGQADAINKGIDMSFGEIIGWLNSDDIYYKDTLKTIVRQDFNKRDFVYGKGMWISKIGKNLLPYPTFEPSFYSFFYQCTLCQPTVFFSKRVFDEVGHLNNEYYCGFDFEYWMRALSMGKNFFKVNEYLAKSRMYNENKTLANQQVVNGDIESFKNKYYKKLKLNEKKIKHFDFVNNRTHEQVQKMRELLESGERVNILFDATVLLNGLRNDAGRSGIFFVALNVLKFLLKREDVEVSLFCFERDLLKLKEFLGFYFKDQDIKIFTEADLIDDGQENSKKKAVESVDVFLSPVFSIPKEIKKRKRMLKYTIIYDFIYFIFPEYFPMKLPWLSEMVEGINEDDFYFAISENTKTDFIKHVPKINQENVKVVYLAASEDFCCKKDEKEREKIFRKYKLPTGKKYIFSLCTLEPRKNLIMSIKTFVKFIEKNKIDDLVFLLGGSHWEDFIKKLELEIENLDNYKEKIIRVGYIEDEDLSAFYSFSEFFVYPSLYEGFGLPVLEAMKCGVPVITSNNSSLPEVLGDAGILINSQSGEEMLEAFEKIYFDYKLRGELSRKGIERAQLFSWEKTVDIMVKDMLNKLRNVDSNKRGENSRMKIRLKEILSRLNFLRKFFLF